MDILENESLRGRAFVDALLSLGETLEDGPSLSQLAANMSQHGPTWSHLGAHLVRTWANLGQLEPTWVNMRQLGVNLGPTYGQLGANLDPHGPTLGQLGHNLGPT